ncbi:MAG: thiamine phosphate synthase, partial [Phenylobacterium sp.]|uniref:thiamine phosphate synthase n=1 Tax=Phenylobacterium sp. TaxID=1871053 RepID=UPI002736F83F
MPLPALLFFTDPARTPDPLYAVAALPQGSAVVLRMFGADDAPAQARAMRQATRARGVLLLVGADPRLAILARADGVHLPERLACRARRIKAAHPGWIVTAAAHSLMAARRARLAGADAVVVSPAFPSASPSAGRPLGALRLAALVRGAGGPAYALGGVNARTAARLKDL